MSSTWWQWMRCETKLGSSIHDESTRGIPLQLCFIPAYSHDMRPIFDASHGYLGIDVVVIDLLMLHRPLHAMSCYPYPPPRTVSGKGSYVSLLCEGAIVNFWSTFVSWFPMVTIKRNRTKLVLVSCRKWVNTMPCRAPVEEDTVCSFTKELPLNISSERWTSL